MLVPQGKETLPATLRLFCDFSRSCRLSPWLSPNRNNSDPARAQSTLAACSALHKQPAGTGLPFGSP